MCRAGKKLFDWCHRTGRYGGRVASHLLDLPLLDLDARQAKLLSREHEELGSPPSWFGQGHRTHGYCSDCQTRKPAACTDVEPLLCSVSQCKQLHGI